MVIIVLASVIQFCQDCVGVSAAIKLQAAVTTNARVRRCHSLESHEDVVIDQKHLVSGDILYIDPGDSIPADCLLIESSDLLINQSRFDRIAHITLCFVLTNLVSLGRVGPWGNLSLAT